MQSWADLSMEMGLFLDKGKKLDEITVTMLGSSVMRARRSS